VPEYEGILYFQEYYSKVFLCLHNISVKIVIGLFHHYKLVTSSPREL